MGIIKPKPVVVYQSRELKDFVNNWLATMYTIRGDFNKLFLNFGFNEHDTIFLSDFDFVDESFQVSSKTNPTEFRMGLTRQTTGDKKSALAILTYPNVQKNYEMAAININGLIVNLISYTLSSDVTGNTLEGKLDKEKRVINLVCGNHEININLVKEMAKNESTYEKHSDSFKIKNEHLIEAYLLNLELPVQIDVLYRKLLELSLFAIDTYNNVEITMQKITPQEKSVVTDYLNAQKGTIKTLTMSRNGRKVTIDSESGKTYKDSEVTAIHDKKNKVSYTLNSPTGFRISDQLIKLEERISSEVANVEEVVARLSR